MKSVVFSAANESFQVSHIIYAGPVQPIPEQLRKGETTHSFKMLTALGTSYCYYRSEENAKKARTALTAKLHSSKQSLYSHRGEIIDPAAVISYGPVYQLKEPQDDFTHSFSLSLKSSQEKTTRLRLMFKSEEAAQSGRRGLYGAINSAYGIAPAAKASAVSGESKESKEQQPEPVCAASQLPF
jgi:hypothetical protein